MKFPSRQFVDPFILGGPLVGLIYLLLKEMLDRPIKKTTKIVILGEKGVGKTELWYRLQGKTPPVDYVATAENRIEKFLLGTKIKEGKKQEVYVESTTDVGGGENYVKSAYEEHINQDGTFIYYLVDLTQLKERKEETLIRVRYIASIIKEKSLKNCGIRILATYLDKYGKSEGEAKKAVADMFGSKIKMDLERIQPINTTDPNDVEKIRQQILKAVK